MPLTKKGKKVKSAFIREYGKHKGLGFFYGFERKHPTYKLIKKRR